MAGALLVPGFAQTASPDPSATTPTSPTTTPGTSTTVGDHDNDFNMGWLGLVGLAGLLGMRRKHTHDEVRNIDNTGPSGIR
jgi:hypothetical protein